MIYDRETGWTEATVTINGEQLSFAEAMTLRVAISSYVMQLQDVTTQKLLGEIAKGYDQTCRSILTKIHRNN